MRVTVNISNDFSYGVLTHNLLAPELGVVAPVPIISLEMIATQFWPPGYAMNQNKLTTTVKHKYMSIVQDGHDCGTMIMDLTNPPLPNYYYVISWPFSSRKIPFGASTVKMNGQPTGCAQTIGLPPLPMMTCGDPVSAPTAYVCPLQLLNGVQVGITPMDLFLGVLSIGLDMLIDLVFEFGFGRQAFRNWGRAFTRTAAEAAEEAAEAVIQNGAQTVARILAREFAGKMGPTNLKGLGKRAVSALSGFGQSILRGNPTLGGQVGGPFLGYGVSTSPNEQGEWQTTRQWSAGGVQQDSTGATQQWGETLP